MSHRSVSCDPAAIDALLSEQLADEHREAIESHLSDCPVCRGRLEELAAEPKVWAETREFLSSSDDLPGGAESSILVGTGLGAWRDEGELPRPEVIAGYLGPTDDPQMLGRFGGYEIAGIIGCGGMGIVLKGLDVPLNRYVAIKVLSPHLATSAAARLRFAREARAAAAVVHEHVIAIHAVSEASGLPFLVMPYVRGQSLQKRLDRVGRMSTTEILRIARQVALGLAAAHAQGLVHRDITLANILLEDGVERLTITDFGLARAADDASLTRSGVIAGTPQFMSPEQARGDNVDYRSDLFSLGSVLYTLCTGHYPFRAETSYGVLRRISEDRPRSIREINPEIPDWLCVLIERLHEKEPARRFQSAQDVAELCGQCLASLQQPGVMRFPAQLTRTTLTEAVPRRSRRVLWEIGLVIAVSCVAAILWRGAGESPEARQSSDSSSAQEQGKVPLSESLRWNDGADDELRALSAEISKLEDETDGSWSK